MPALNRVQLIGRLGTKPTTRYTPKGRKVTSFTLAVGQRWRDKNGATHETTDWFSVEVWGKLGEICEQYLNKGRLVYIEGKLRTRRINHNGVTRYTARVIAKQMQILDRRRKEEEPITEEEQEENGESEETSS
ncbi:MAG: single-stranded DNA-binding protein [Anaerolineales bacterium]|nr:single-stranded DNA-binding protein [Anaerolineales bacterium]MCS7248675.1 single-stranded DNA-binding protein [Anaerolineales bacterium]MDW8162488.1 single-stranded DNA-binding protein [Anaerolineales bacterium]MDW8445913.1 single-stranded DNA-binding protein [Anaerolineales bacterium]